MVDNAKIQLLAFKAIKPPEERNLAVQTVHLWHNLLFMPVCWQSRLGLLRKAPLKDGCLLKRDFSPKSEKRSVVLID